jgi:uncharacterized protein
MITRELLSTALAIVIGLGTAGCADRSGSLGNHFDKAESRALIEAACRGDSAAVGKAVAAGATPNELGRNGLPPLFWAMRFCDERGVEALLGAGADPNAKYAAGGLHCGAVWVAARNPNPKILPLLLAHGGDPNMTCDGSSETPLLRAFAFGIEHEDMRNYQTLLKAGADINQEQEGRTVATSAAALARFEVVQDLLDRGYDNNLQYLTDIVELGQVYSPEQAQARASLLKRLYQRGSRPQRSSKTPSR